MQQVIQPIDGHATEVVELPVPVCGPGQVLIANAFSLISAGTERSTVGLAKQSLIQKARQRPDHVRRVLEKVRQEGLGNTIRQVRAKLSQPIPLGYSSAGIVVEVGDGVREFQVGDRVASNGPHAGACAIPKNLVAHVPDNVPLDHACYAVIGSIALQGIRLAKVGLGDVVGVIGLGLIGQVAVSLLKAAGCVVVGTDLDPSKRKLALEMGADHVGDGGEFARLLQQHTRGHGADAVLLTASTSSNGPLELAAQVSRQKGKIVAVGAVGLEVPRREFYPKELELVVSCSYGPGRYDVEYEDHGHDYPYAYVRWTEQRNIAAVLEQMSRGNLPVEKLTTHRFAIEEAEKAYELVESAAGAVGIVLSYPPLDQSKRSVALPKQTVAAAKDRATLGCSVVGAGNFASATLIPTFEQDGGFELQGLVSAGGMSAHSVGKKHGFAYAATDLQQPLDDAQTDVVVIATRHDEHTPMALAALRAGKAVFIEKPLVVNEEQFEDWKSLLEHAGAELPVWMLGFNRRFSPAAGMVRDAFAAVQDPKTLTIRFNAGQIPDEHWIHDAEIGGGRLIGEACHAIDLATYLIGSPPCRVYAEAAYPRSRKVTDDNVLLTMRHEDGSVSVVHYAADGNRSAGKERVEMFGGGVFAAIDDFRKVEIFPAQGKPIVKKWLSQQKGYSEEVRAFYQGVRSGQPPIPYSHMLRVTAASLRAVQSLRIEMPLEVAE